MRQRQARRRSPEEGTKSADHKAMLTIPEVMARLSLCYDTVWSLIRRGELPAVRLGTWRVEPDDLEAFIARRKTAAQVSTPAAAAIDADRQFDGPNRFL